MRLNKMERMAMNFLDDGNVERNVNISVPSRGIRKSQDFVKRTFLQERVRFGLES